MFKKSDNKADKTPKQEEKAHIAKTEPVSDHPEKPVEAKTSKADDVKKS